mmetsp:Transcript_12851/g.34033  ORF Transcript_12851/g.34033 Transcript_12851/m.34033 type:complete len:236 (+) Transcript_12851:1798-2505(+)
MGSLVAPKGQFVAHWANSNELKTTIAEPPRGASSPACSMSFRRAASARRIASAGSAASSSTECSTKEQQQMHPSMHLAQPCWIFFFSPLSHRRCSSSRHRARSISFSSSMNLRTRPRNPPSPVKYQLRAPTSLTTVSMSVRWWSSAARMDRVDAPVAFSRAILSSCAATAALASPPSLRGGAPPSSSWTARVSASRWRHGTTATTLPGTWNTLSKNVLTSSGSRNSSGRPVHTTA